MREGLDTAPTGAGTEPAPALSLRGVSKRFGSVVANDEVSLDIHAGRVHGLLGENGAGKSTLMNIVVGLMAADQGAIELDCQPIDDTTTRRAIELGIAMVHQHFMVIPTLTVAENLQLAIRASSPRRHRDRLTSELMRAVGERHGVELEPSKVVDSLSVGEKLRLEILKALMQGEQRGGLRVFILDEPTALLTRQEIERLFRILRSLADAGTAVVIITHKLSEVGEVCDDVTVLRDGRVVATLPARNTPTSELGRLMIGREVPPRRRVRHADAGDPLLRVEGLSVSSGDHVALSEVDLTVRSGEVVGIVGVAGNGQEELARCVTGLLEPDAGRITIEGDDVTGVARRQLIQDRVAHIPEDRRHDALVTSLSIEHNSILGLNRMAVFQRRGWQHQGAIERHAQSICRDYEVRTPDSRVLLEHLSGGNQQRVVVGRELGKDPSLVVASGPTRGLDVLGIEYIHDRLLEQRDRGAAVLLISLDLDELLKLSDRLVVLQGGHVRGELDAGEVDQEQLGLMMGGGRGRARTSRGAAS